MCSSIGRLSDSTTGAPSAVDLEAEAPRRPRRAAGTARSASGARATAPSILRTSGTAPRAADALAVRRREGRAPALEQRRCRRGLALGVDRARRAARRPSGARPRRAALRARVRSIAGTWPGVVRTVKWMRASTVVAQQHVEFGAGAVERREQDALELAAAGRSSSSRAARTPGTRRSVRTGRAGRTGAAAAVRPAPGCPAPSRRARRRRSGTARRADRSRGCGSAPWPDGRPGAQAGALGDRRDLAAQQRHLGHARAVGRRGEQADEAVLADHLAARRRSA